MSKQGRHLLKRFQGITFPVGSALGSALTGNKRVSMYTPGFGSEVDKLRVKAYTENVGHEPRELYDHPTSMLDQFQYTRRSKFSRQLFAQMQMASWNS
jgi:hypothetical protein